MSSSSFSHFACFEAKRCRFSLAERGNEPRKKRKTSGMQARKFPSLSLFLFLFFVSVASSGKKKELPYFSTCRSLAACVHARSASSALSWAAAFESPTAEARM